MALAAPAALAAAAAYQRSSRRLGDAAAAAAVARFDRIDYFGELDESFLDDAAALDETAQEAQAMLLAGYLSTLLGHPVQLDLAEATGEAIRPEGTRRSWAILFLALWAALSSGQRFDEARAVAREEAAGQMFTSLSWAQRAGLRAALSGEKEVQRFRRIISPGACDFCAVISEQVYFKEELMPAHPRCRCSVAPIVSGSDPGLALNQQTRRRQAQREGAA